MDMKDIIWRNKNKWEYNLDKLKSFVSEESKKYTGKGELCKAMGVYRDFLDNVQKKEKIEFEYNFIVLSNNTKYKAVYQNYDWCYQKYVIERKSYQEMADELGVTKRVIQKWCVEKHGIHNNVMRNLLKLNKEQESLVLGSLLGDGHITNNEQPIFIISHAENQKGYLFWKYDIIKNLCNKEPKKYDGITRDFKGKRYKCQDFYRLNTKIIDDFVRFRDMTKCEIISSLNELSLVIFVLDDGCREDSNWVVCVAEFSDEDKHLFVNKMKEKFNLSCHITKDDRYILFDSHATKKLDDMILKIVPNDLDIVKYKLTKNDSLRKYIGYVYVILKNEERVGISYWFKLIGKTYDKQIRQQLLDMEMYEIEEGDLVKLLDEIN